ARSRGRAPARARSPRCWRSTSVRLRRARSADRFAERPNRDRTNGGERMGAGMFVAWSSPVSAEQDAEFNDWYENVHMPQVCEAVGTVTRVRRFTVLGSGAEDGVKRYFACYELADDDVAAAAAAVQAAGAAGKFDI